MADRNSPSRNDEIFSLGDSFSFLNLGGRRNNPNVTRRGNSQNSGIEASPTPSNSRTPRRGAIRRTTQRNTGSPVCRFFGRGMCQFGARCRYFHADADSSSSPRRSKKPHQVVASPSSPTKSPKNFYRKKELAEALERSKNQACGICFDVVLEKKNRDQYFGILPNCTHCFCLSCIRKWRSQTEEIDKKIIRACPECRIKSDFVCPSRYWVDNKEDKDKLVNNYKKSLGERDCKHYMQGQETCPFGNKCFFRHALPDGTKVNVGPPPRRPRPRRDSSEDSFEDPIPEFWWDPLF